MEGLAGYVPGMATVETVEMKDLRIRRPMRPPMGMPQTATARPRHWADDLRNPLVDAQVSVPGEKSFTCSWCGCESSRVALIQHHPETAICEGCLHDAGLMLRHMTSAS